jgi:hypothetical protein
MPRVGLVEQSNHFRLWGEGSDVLQLQIAMQDSNFANDSPRLDRIISKQALRL